MTASTYLWLKAAHVGAAVLFIGGTLATSMMLAAMSASPQPTVAAGLLRKDRWLTTPALLVTWIVGLTLAVTGGWFTQRWLPIKLGLVVAVTAIHGMQVGQLRRLADGGAPGRWNTVPLITASAVIIAALAVLKPS